MKRVLIIKGSPRRGGNSDCLADAFAQGAREAGHTVMEFAAARHKINGCLACGACWSKGQPCIQQDDMALLFPMMREAQVAVWATPLYYYGFSSQTKAVMDRMYPFGGSEPERQLKIKETALLVTCADKEEDALDGVKANYRLCARYMKWKDLGVIQGTGLWEKGAIEGHPALEEAYALGKSL